MHSQIFEVKSNFNYILTKVSNIFSTTLLVCVEKKNSDTKMCTSVLIKQFMNACKYRIQYFSCTETWTHVVNLCMEIMYLFQHRHQKTNLKKEKKKPHQSEYVFTNSNKIYKYVDYERHIIYTFAEYTFLIFHSFIE